MSEKPTRPILQLPAELAEQLRRQMEAAVRTAQEVAAKRGASNNGAAD